MADDLPEMAFAGGTAGDWLGVPADRASALAVDRRGPGDLRRQHVPDPLRRGFPHRERAAPRDQAPWIAHFVAIQGRGEAGDPHRPTRQR